MDLRKYQDAVLNGSLLKGEGREFTVSVLGLAGESGEVADLLKKSLHPGNTLDIGHFIEELGDVLWYLTHLAGLQGYSLEELASINYNKLAERYPYKYTQVLE